MKVAVKRIESRAKAPAVLCLGLCYLFFAFGFTCTLSSAVPDKVEASSYVVYAGNSLEFGEPQTNTPNVTQLITSAPKFGSITYNPNTRRLSYTPFDTYQGIDTLEYKVGEKEVSLSFQVKVKRIGDTIKPNDIFKIAEQYIKWTDDADANGTFSQNEIQKYDFKKEEFVNISPRDYQHVVEWGIGDWENRDKSTVYKTVGDREIRLIVDYPKGWQPTDKRPVALFFFGGGFNTGFYYKGDHRANFYNSLGIVYARCDYRVRTRDDAILGSKRAAHDRAFSDCKDAVRWIKSHSSELGIDPNKLIATGTSAGTMVAELHFTKDPVLRPAACVLQVPYGADPFLPVIRKNVDNRAASAPPMIAFCAENDPISNPHGVNLINALNEGGGYGEAYVFPNEAHTLSPQAYPELFQKTKEFLTKVELID